MHGRVVIVFLAVLFGIAAGEEYKRQGFPEQFSQLAGQFPGGLSPPSFSNSQFPQLPSGFAPPSGFPSVPSGFPSSPFGKRETETEDDAFRKALSRMDMEKFLEFVKMLEKSPSLKRTLDPSLYSGYFDKYQEFFQPLTGSTTSSTGSLGPIQFP